MQELCNGVRISTFFAFTKSIRLYLLITTLLLLLGGNLSGQVLNVNESPTTSPAIHSFIKEPAFELADLT